MLHDSIQFVEITLVLSESLALYCVCNTDTIQSHSVHNVCIFVPCSGYSIYKTMTALSLMLAIVQFRTIYYSRLTVLLLSIHFALSLHDMIPWSLAKRIARCRLTNIWFFIRRIWNYR